MNKSFQLSNSPRIFFVIAPILFACIGSILSYSKFFGESKDYQGYWEYFTAMESADDCLNAVSDSFEVGFHQSVCFLAPIFKSADTLMAFFVFISLAIKLSVLSAIVLRFELPDDNAKKCFLLCTLFYFSRFFPIHELTQIRISLGITFAFLGVLALTNNLTSTGEEESTSIDSKVRFKSSLNLLLAILMFCLACLFHNSVIAALPLFAMAFYVRKPKDVFLISLFILFFVKILFVDYIIPNVLMLNPRIGEYLYDLNPSNSPNYFFSISRILDVFLAAIALSFFDAKNKYQTYFMSLWIFSMVSFYSLIDVPVMALRFTDLLQTFGILLVAVMRSKQQILFTTIWVAMMVITSMYAFYNGKFFS